MENHVTHKSWFSRNWPWAVPLGGCLVFIILIVAFVGTVIYGVSKGFSESTPYKEALAKVNQDEYVIGILGEPIETNGIMNGRFEFTNGKGSADISIPIKGPDGKGRLYVVGNKENDQWNYTDMYVIIDMSNEQIDLLGYENDAVDEQ